MTKSSDKYRYIEERGGGGGVRWTNVITLRWGKIDKEFRQVTLYRGEGVVRWANVITVRRGKIDEEFRQVC